MFYAYLPWIHGQVERRWQDVGAASRVAADLGGTLMAFGAAADPTGQSVTLPLGAIKGRESDLVDALVQLVARIAVVASERTA